MIWWFQKGKKQVALTCTIRFTTDDCSVYHHSGTTSHLLLRFCVDNKYKNKSKKEIFFSIFIMKYLFKRNVQVEPAQWHLGIYLRKTETPDRWCRSDVCKMIMYIFTAEDPLEWPTWVSMTEAKYKRDWLTEKNKNRKKL